MRKIFFVYIAIVTLFLASPPAHPALAATINLADAATTLTIERGTITTDTTLNNIIFSGLGSLIKTGSGSLTLTGANDFSGTLDIKEGTLILGAPGSITKSSMILGAGVTFDYQTATGSPSALKSLAVNGLGAKVIPNAGGADFSGGSLLFNIPSSAGNNSVLLLVDGDADITGANVSLAGTPPSLKVGDEITLIDASAGTLSGTLNTTATIPATVTTPGYVFEISTTGPPDKLIATVKAVIPPLRPDPDPGPDPALSSADILSVTINGTKYNLAQQADGSWLVTVPYGTDLSKLKPAFILRHPNAKIEPSGDAEYDFDHGRTVTFKVTSADGLYTKTYKIIVVAREFQVANGTLTAALANGWTLAATRSDDGAYTFTLTAPTHSSITSSHLPSKIYVTIDPELSNLALAILDALGIVIAPYPNEQFLQAAAAASEPNPPNPPNPPKTFRITGRAANRAALEKLSIAQIDYMFEGDVGRSYRQVFSSPITYASIPEGNKTVDPEPAPDPTPVHKGGGCNVELGVLGVLGMLAAACAARKRE